MEQQPIRLTVGRRQQRSRSGTAAGSDAAGSDAGGPDAAVRAAYAQMAGYRTRAPKGIFFYRSAEEMNADRMRWTIAAMVEKARGGSG